MTNNILTKYAQLLTHYCLEVKAGDKLFVKTTLLAEPLVKEIYRECQKIGAIVEFSFSFSDQNKIFYNNANETQLEHVPSGLKTVMEEFDAYLVIRAPYNLREDQGIDKSKKKLRSKALSEINKIYFNRTGTRDLRRSLCQFPTQASAQMAGMSLEEYQKFVFNACYLYADDPEAEWRKVSQRQQKYVDFLNTKDLIQYKNGKTDISFSVKDRIWINSDGQTNMPSGEVYSGPIEDSVNGVVHFNYPSIYMGEEVQDITLVVENGKVIKATAKQGQEFLSQILKLDGADRFGEVAVGTNYNIKRATKNILFDEKIGGTIHMALGQSYPQCGAKNKSEIHWDMITDMSAGAIYADGEKIYENGAFIESVIDKHGA